MVLKMLMLLKFMLCSIQKALYICKSVHIFSVNHMLINYCQIFFTVTSLFGGLSVYESVQKQTAFCSFVLK